MQKLRELKNKHEERGSQLQDPEGSAQPYSSPSSKMDDLMQNESQIATTIISENAKLKKDIEFATMEIQRLRAKLVIDDEFMPEIQAQLLGGKWEAKERNESSMGPAIRGGNSFVVQKDSDTFFRPIDSSDRANSVSGDLSNLRETMNSNKNASRND